jgi:hypothetical protein
MDLGGRNHTLLEALVAAAAVRGQADLDLVSLELVSVDSIVARAHHHAAGRGSNPELLENSEKAVAEDRSRAVHPVPGGVETGHGAACHGAWCGAVRA